MTLQLTSKSTEQPITIPIYAENSQLDTMPFPHAIPHEINGELCWAVRIFNLAGLLRLLDQVGGTLRITRHGAYGCGALGVERYGEPHGLAIVIPYRITEDE